MSKQKKIVAVVSVVVATLAAVLAAVHKIPLRRSGSLFAASSRIQSAPLKGPFTAPGSGPKPIPIYKPDPPYTLEARRAKTQGTVVAWVTVGADGAVKDATIIKSLDPGLDQNAVNTIKTWKFKPAMRDNMPVPAGIMVEVSFRILVNGVR